MEELERADGLDALQCASEALRNYYGIDHVVYHWVDSAGDHMVAGLTLMRGALGIWNRTICA